MEIHFLISLFILVSKSYIPAFARCKLDLCKAILENTQLCNFHQLKIYSKYVRKINKTEFELSERQAKASNSKFAMRIVCKFSSIKTNYII